MARHRKSFVETLSEVSASPARPGFWPNISSYSISFYLGIHTLSSFFPSASARKEVRLAGQFPPDSPMPDHSRSIFGGGKWDFFSRRGSPRRLKTLHRQKQLPDAVLPGHLMLGIDAK